MQCVDVAGLQKYAMGQADTKYDAMRRNPMRERQKGKKDVWPKSRQLAWLKKLTIAMWLRDIL